jgi:hypothetical protein
VTIAPALEKLPADPDAARDHVDEAVVTLLTD